MNAIVVMSKFAYIELAVDNMIDDIISRNIVTKIQNLIIVTV